MDRSRHHDERSPGSTPDGSKKEGVAYNYAGQRAGRPYLATWAEAGLTTAADLLAGNEDVRPRAADMLRRGLAGIPEPVRVQAATHDRLRTRADAGFFTADLAHAAVGEVAPRTSPGATQDFSRTSPLDGRAQ